jgi:UDP-3-O-[3-hydroxymyristoyl] glucosamine N-acyltransferase
MKRSLQEIADCIGARLIGDGTLQVSGVAGFESAAAADLVFVDDHKHLEAAFGSKAGAIIAGNFAASAASLRPLLISDQPKLAFARAAQLLRDAPANSMEDIHSAAVVHPSSRVGIRTRIAPGSVVGDGVVIGESCHIYPNVTIYPGTTIGNRVIIHAGAVLGSDGFGYVRDGKTRRYEKFPQVGTLVIEDDVEIGANTTIDRGALDETRIRRGTKIDNLVHIGHNCQIGEDVVIAAQTGLSGSIVIENGVVLGGQVGIGERAHIGEGVMLGGQGGVLPNKILRGKGVAFWGTPAQPVREYLKQLATLARLTKKE